MMRPAPMVMVALNGGLGTLESIREALIKGRPVLVLAESGGASSHIFYQSAYARELADKEQDQDIEEDAVRQVTRADLKWLDDDPKAQDHYVRRQAPLPRAARRCPASCAAPPRALPRLVR